MMRHEPVIYAFKDTKRHNWYGGRKVSSVWEFDRPSSSKLHTTMKSLPLLAFPIKNSSLENSILLEPFSGSFSTGIVCEQLNRICYAMEIDEKFVDVGVKRYIQQIGSDDNVFLVRDG